MKTEFDSAVRSSEPLKRIDQLIWQHLGDAVRTKDHPWKEGYFSTVAYDASGKARPSTRTVILRAWEAEWRTLDFHTDVRSPKVQQLDSSGGAAPVCWLFYDRSEKVQVRMEGTARVIDGDLADEAWRDTWLPSRSSYLSLAQPGASTPEQTPPDTSDRNVSQQESERGRVNFRIVRTSVESADWLYLRREGHLRASFNYDKGEIKHRHWLVP